MNVLKVLRPTEAEAGECCQQESQRSRQGFWHSYLTPTDGSYRTGRYHLTLSMKVADISLPEHYSLF